MKFKIRRTSDWDKKPCRKATKETYTRIDDRTTNDPAKIPAAHGESNWWYEEGRNHRIEGGRIMRDFDAEGWFIELSSLEELIKFINKYGSIVIEQYYDNHNILEIEIYDDYTMIIGSSND